MMNPIVKSVLDLQALFYIFGPGDTGRSQLVQLLTLLLGENNVHTTTLKALQTDSLEVVNLANKKLNTINDIKDYIQDISIVKAFTGNDSLRARIMRENTSLGIGAAGFVLAVANQPLSVKDRGNAIVRRMRPFKTVNVPSSRKPLLERISSNSWRGRGGSSYL